MTLTSHLPAAAWWSQFACQNQPELSSILLPPGQRKICISNHPIWQGNPVFMQPSTQTNTAHTRQSRGKNVPTVRGDSSRDKWRDRYTWIADANYTLLLPTIQGCGVRTRLGRHRALLCPLSHSWLSSTDSDPHLWICTINTCWRLFCQLVITIITILCVCVGGGGV